MTAADRLRYIAGDAADRTITGQPISGRKLHDIALWAADAADYIFGSDGAFRDELLADLDRIVEEEP